MDDIEKMMFDYVSTGRQFAGLWMAMNAAGEADILMAKMDTYLRRLRAREARPEEGGEFAEAVREQLRTLRSEILAARDAAPVGSGKRFALEKRETDLATLSDVWQRFFGLRESILDRRAALELLA